MATTITAVHVLNDRDGKVAYVVEAHFDRDLYIAYPAFEEENSTCLIRFTGTSDEEGVPTANIVG